jgi:hypothetical protein
MIKRDDPTATAVSPRRSGRIITDESTAGRQFHRCRRNREGPAGFAPGNFVKMAKTRDQRVLWLRSLRGVKVQECGEYICIHGGKHGERRSSAVNAF